MSGKYVPILLMTGLLLIVMIGYYAIFIYETPVVEPGELDVTIQTDDNIYLLGENIEVSVYLYNNRLTPVKIDQEGLSYGIGVWIYSPLSDVSVISMVEGSSITVPAKSRMLWGKTTFKATATGTFTIECSGEKVTVKVVFKEEETTL